MNGLQKVVLLRCSSVDLSCLGSLPDLTVLDCSKVSGHHSLTHNRRIVISGSEFQDFSEIFTDSEVITILSVSHVQDAVTFDLSHWKKVRSLTLKTHDSNYKPSSTRGIINHLHFKSNRIPPTLKRLSVGGDFISLVDWKPFTSQLVELSLSDSWSLHSLEGMNLDGIAVVSLTSLKALKSLDGLGGDHEKVVVEDCLSWIRDFSMLQSVASVSIFHSEGFQDGHQVSGVQELDLRGCYPKTGYDRWLGMDRSLWVRKRSPLLRSFAGLEKIPSVKLSCSQVMSLYRFVVEDKQSLQNERIRIDCYQESAEADCVRMLFSSYLAESYELSEMQSKSNGIATTAMILTRREG